MLGVNTTKDHEKINLQPHPHRGGSQAGREGQHATSWKPRSSAVLGGVKSAISCPGNHGTSPQHEKWNVCEATSWQGLLGVTESGSGIDKRPDTRCQQGKGGIEEKPLHPALIKRSVSRGNGTEWGGGLYRVENVHHAAIHLPHRWQNACEASAPTEWHNDNSNAILSG